MSLLTLEKSLEREFWLRSYADLPELTRDMLRAWLFVCVIPAKDARFYAAERIWRDFCAESPAVTLEAFNGALLMEGHEARLAGIGLKTWYFRVIPRPGRLEVPSNEQKGVEFGLWNYDDPAIGRFRAHLAALIEENRLHDR